MYCPKCGTTNADNAQFCIACRHPLAPGPAGPEQYPPSTAPSPAEYPPYPEYAAVPSGEMRTSGLAIAALVLGIVGLLCFGPLAGIPGLILGIIALKKINAQPQVLGGKGLAIAGVVVSAIAIVLGVISIFMIVPAIKKAMNQAFSIVCQEQLNQISTAFDEYRNDYDGKYPEKLNVLVEEDYLPGTDIFHCPASGMRTRKISYIYRGADLDASAGTEMILVYDMHDNHKGAFRNVLFADGHVKQMEEDEFLEAVSRDNELRRELNLSEKPPD